MATIKEYTDLLQSKVLAEILPLESADMFYSAGNEIQPEFKLHSYGHIMSDEDTPCWSLVALLSVLPDIHLKKYIYDGITKYYVTLVWIRQINSKHYDNPVDACYEMIIKFYEQDIL